MKCVKCGYEWEPRVENPKSCPDCKTRLKLTAHPIQPLVTIDGVVRFKENKIVRYLLDEGPFDMNHLATIAFSDVDREQFAQLIGYSISGFGELSYVSDSTYNAALSTKDKP